MIELATALGLVLVIEGLLYASVPGRLKQLMLQVQEVPDDTLRLAGVAAVAIGVGLVCGWRAPYWAVHDIVKPSFLRKRQQSA